MALARRLAEIHSDVEGGHRSGDWLLAMQWEEPVYEAGQVCRVRAWVRLAGASEASRFEASHGMDGAVVEAHGYGMAPLGQTFRPSGRGRWLDPPAWASRRLIASGRGADKEPAAAERVAHIDAMVKLAREVDSLPLPERMGGTVRAFILAHPDCADVWSAFLESVRLTDERSSASEATVMVEIELDRLWDSITRAGAM